MMGFSRCCVSSQCSGTCLLFVVALGHVSMVGCVVLNFFRCLFTSARSLSCAVDGDDCDGSSVVGLRGSV